MQQFHYELYVSLCLAPELVMNEYMMRPWIEMTWKTSSMNSRQTLFVVPHRAAGVLLRNWNADQYNQLIVTDLMHSSVRNGYKQSVSFSQHTPPLPTHTGNVISDKISATLSDASVCNLITVPLNGFNQCLYVFTVKNKSWNKSLGLYLPHLITWSLFFLWLNPGAMIMWEAVQY